MLSKVSLENVGMRMFQCRKRRKRHESRFVTDFFCSWSSWLAQRRLFGAMIAVNKAADRRGGGGGGITLWYIT